MAFADQPQESGPQDRSGQEGNLAARGRCGPFVIDVERCKGARVIDAAIRMVGSLLRMFSSACRSRRAVTSSRRTEPFRNTRPIRILRDRESSSTSRAEQAPGRALDGDAERCFSSTTGEFARRLRHRPPRRVDPREAPGEKISCYGRARELRRAADERRAGGRSDRQIVSATRFFKAQHA